MRTFLVLCLASTACFSVESAPAPAPASASTDGGGPAVASISAGPLDFGLVKCGSRAASQVVTISNNGGTPFTWNASLAKGATSPFALSTQTGTVGPGSTVALVVTPADVQASAAVTANALGDTLNLTTTAPGDTPHAVDLKQTATGTVVANTPNQLTFGLVAVGKASASSNITFTNNGNTPATITLASSKSAYAVSPTTLTIAAGATGTAAVVYTPDDVGDQSATISIASTDSTCGGAVAPVTASGTGQLVATKVALGRWHSCAIVQDGRVACWGSNSYGQLGIEATIPSSATPVLVHGLTGVKDLGLGKMHSCALTTDGSVMCWGFGGDGTMGNGKLANSTVPSKVLLPGTASALGVGNHAACAGQKTGPVWCWGGGFVGKFPGRGSNPTPTPVSGLAGADSIALGTNHACATSGGQVFCWGMGTNGQLGNSAKSNSDVPVQVSGITTAKSIALGNWHSCAILGDGTAKCWGSDGNSQLGDNAFADSPVPVSVQALTSVASIGGGYSRTCGVQGGQAFCWGQMGILGFQAWPVSPNQTVPLATIGVSDATSIGVGRFDACTVNAKGAIQCWGRNDHGQLGDGTSNEAATPVAVRFTGL